MKSLNVRILMIMLMMLLVGSLSTVGFAEEGVRYTDHAEILKELGLFSGTNR